MNKLLIPVARCLSTFPGLVNVRLLIPNFKLLVGVSDGAGLLVNRKVLHGPVFKTVHKGCGLLLLLVCHMAPSAYASDLSTRAQTVKYLARTKPHEVRRADFSCPDRTAIQVPGQAHAGAYVPCEEFDAYQALMRAGSADEAAKLLMQQYQGGTK